MAAGLPEGRREICMKLPWIPLLAVGLLVAIVAAVWSAFVWSAVGEAPWEVVKTEPTQPPPEPAPTPPLCPTAPDIQKRLDEAVEKMGPDLAKLTPLERRNRVDGVSRMITDALQPTVEAIQRKQQAGDCRPARTREDLRELCSLGDHLACDRLSEENP